MRRWCTVWLVALALLASGGAAVAATSPAEMLDDPALEQRARELGKQLRCVVCQNQSIDDSNAPLAKDLRELVRERLVAGDSNEAAVAYIVDRYGEYVLLRPRMTGENIALYAAGPVMLLIGFGIALVYLRRRRGTPEPQLAALSEAERARLREILDR